MSCVLFQGENMSVVKVICDDRVSQYFVEMDRDHLNELKNDMMTFVKDLEESRMEDLRELLSSSFDRESLMISAFDESEETGDIILSRMSDVMLMFCMEFCEDPTNPELSLTYDTTGILELSIPSYKRKDYDVTQASVSKIKRALDIFYK